MSTSLPAVFTANPNLHAYLYVSGDMNSRHGVSRAMAKSILCRNRTEGAEPCGKCDCCIKMDAGTHPDCIVVPAAVKTTVDDIRDIVSEAYLATNEADFKVFILEDADEYNGPSQNALLKVIEEPPSFVRFVLTASSAGAILPTVRSRVCSISGNVKKIENIADELRKARQELSESQIMMLSYFAEGYDKADVSALDEKAIENYLDKAHLFLSGKETDVILSLPSKRDELMLCLQVFMLCIRQIALVKMTGKLTAGILSEKLVSECNSKVSMKKAHALYDLFEECYLSIEGYANSNAVLTYLFEKSR